MSLESRTSTTCPFWKTQSDLFRDVTGQSRATRIAGQSTSHVSNRFLSGSSLSDSGEHNHVGPKRCKSDVPQAEATRHAQGTICQTTRGLTFRRSCFKETECHFRKLVAFHTEHLRHKRQMCDSKVWDCRLFEVTGSSEASCAEVFLHFALTFVDSVDDAFGIADICTSWLLHEVV